MAEFTLESKLNLISFGLSIGLGGKPSSEWPPQEKDGRQGAARRHEAAGRM
ncbi:hypothetical protein [Bradyrhizobium sp. sGM-13]|uniref:hypothetical protein n=1 Tax=Bradyrhizobium sp. sGM-13 TaxID=2831781 RepID=UPI001BCBD871|nr:hypothetical protein [Bradyrhizobium sp. sGM-13]